MKSIKLIGTLTVALLGIYGTFLWERKAEVVLEVLANSSVLDVRESLNDLVITYRGTNLKEKNQALYLITIRVANIGNADVLKSSYDVGEPLGFKFGSGVIVESPSIIGEDYFVNNVRPHLKGSNSIVLAPVIMNEGDSFRIKVLLLAKADEIPKISPSGKLAGIQRISVTQPDVTGSAPYWHTVFGGDILIQLGRLLYLFVAIIAIIVILATVGLPIMLIGNHIGRSSRKKKVDNFRRSLGRVANLKEEYLLSQYIEQSLIFRRFKRILMDPPGDQELPPYQEAEKRIIYREEEGALINAGVIVRDGPQITVDQEIEPVARALMAFIAGSSASED